VSAQASEVDASPPALSRHDKAARDAIHRQEMGVRVDRAPGPAGRCVEHGDTPRTDPRRAVVDAAHGHKHLAVPCINREPARRAAAPDRYRVQNCTSTRVEHEHTARVDDEGASRCLIDDHGLGASADRDGAYDDPGRRVERGHAPGATEDEDATDALVHRQRDRVAAYGDGAWQQRCSSPCFLTIVW